MAIPIKQTPTLGKRATGQFLARVERDLATPTSIKETPKIQEAKRIALSHAVLRPKHTSR